MSSNSQSIDDFEQLNQLSFYGDLTNDFYDQFEAPLTPSMKKKMYRDSQSADARLKRMKKDSERHRRYYMTETEEQRIQRKQRDAQRHKEAYMKKKQLGLLKTKKMSIAQSAPHEAVDIDIPAITLLSAAAASKSNGADFLNNAVTHIIVPNTFAHNTQHTRHYSHHKIPQQLPQQQQHQERAAFNEDGGIIQQTGVILHQMQQPSEQHINQHRSSASIVGVSSSGGGSLMSYQNSRQAEHQAAMRNISSRSNNDLLSHSTLFSLSSPSSHQSYVNNVNVDTLVTTEDNITIHNNPYYFVNESSKKCVGIVSLYGSDSDSSDDDCKDGK